MNQERDIETSEDVTPAKPALGSISKSAEKPALEPSLKRSPRRRMVRRVLFGDQPRETGTIRSDWRKLLWIFTVVAMLGLLGETTEHFIMFNGEIQSRAGALWGPFSPLYGLAAVLFTVSLEPLRNRGLVPLFLASALLGGVLEYFASWAMESFWGIVAWSYLTWPLNFDGRTCVFYMFVWGALGTLWVKLGLRAAEWVFCRVDEKHLGYRLVSGALAIFMVVNLSMTVIVMIRTDARANGIPPQNPIEQAIDDTWSYEELQSRFGNMGGIGIP